MVRAFVAHWLLLTLEMEIELLFTLGLGGSTAPTGAGESAREGEATRTW